MVARQNKQKQHFFFGLGASVRQKAKIKRRFTKIKRRFV